jgi:DNA repair protein RecO (recombination protein O)
MPPIKDQAIVLRHLDYSETSQVLVCLTRGSGPRRFIAKGIKRGTKQKAAAIIDLLEEGEVIFLAKPQSESELAILAEWHQVDAHLGLREHLPAWYAGQYAAEITAAMTEEADPHPELYDTLSALLAFLSDGQAVLPALVSYQCAVLLTAGLWPDLTRCVLCSRPAPPGRAAYYAPGQGGLVCRQCEPRVPARRYINAAGLEALRTRQFEESTLLDAFQVLDETIASTMGRPTQLGPLIVNR